MTNTCKFNYSNGPCPEPRLQTPILGTHRIERFPDPNSNGSNECVISTCDVEPCSEFCNYHHKVMTGLMEPHSIELYGRVEQAFCIAKYPKFKRQTWEGQEV